MPTKKYALVLSGGGFKGAFQVGALNYILENDPAKPGGIHHKDGTINRNPKFDIVAGISTGAINGSLVASGRFNQLKGFWDEVGRRGAAVIMDSDLIDIATMKPGMMELINGIGFDTWYEKFIFGILPTGLTALLRGRDIKRELLSRKSIASSAPLYEHLKQNVSKQLINQYGALLSVGSVSLIDGEYYKYAHHDLANDDELHKAILSSATMPAIFEPVDKVVLNIANQPNHVLVDGGIRNVSPMKDVIGYIESEYDTWRNAGRPVDVEYYIILINCHSDKFAVDTSKNYENFLSIALRSLNDIALKEIFNNDISEFERINELIRQAEAHNATLPAGAQKLVLTKKSPNGNIVLNSYKFVKIQPDDNDGNMGDSLDASSAKIAYRLEAGHRKAKQVFDAIAANPNW